MSFELATLFLLLGFQHGRRNLCCFRQAATPPPPAAEPEVAFLVHDLYNIMIKLVII